MRPANASDYYVDKITLLFKEQFISRKDMLQVIENCIDDIVYVNKEIKLLPNPENDELSIGNIGSFKGTKSKTPLTGLVTVNTDFQLKSLNAGVYFLIEVSKDTFDFCIMAKTKFEMIVEFLKNTLQKLKEKECGHIIHIIFFTRIFFEKKDCKKMKNKLKNFSDFVYQSDIFPGEYFIDIYSCIVNMQINKIDITTIAELLYSAFTAFASIFTVNNLSDYVSNIKNFEKSSEIFNEKTINSFQYFNDIFSTSFFSEITEFRMTKSITSNLFESVNVIINDIRNEKKNLFKLGNIITIISSGEYFPYYCNRLNKIVKENLYEQGIPLTLVILSSRIKSNEIYSKELNNFSNYQDYICKQSYKDLREDRIDRDTSFYSLKGVNEEDNNSIKQAINRNYGILEDMGLDRKKRRRSSDNINITKENNNQGAYKYESDNFTHKSPKWMKVFYINSAENNFFSIFNSKEKPTYSSNYMKRKLSYINYDTFANIDNVDMDIFNSKKMTTLQPSKVRKSISEEYVDLSVANNEHGMKINSNEPFLVSNDNGSHRKSDLIYDKNLTLESLKENLSIFKNDRQNTINDYLLINTNNTNSNFTNNQNSSIFSNSYTTNFSNANTANNSNANDESLKEFDRKTAEYDNEIFSFKKMSKTDLKENEKVKNFFNKLGRK